MIDKFKHFGFIALVLGISFIVSNFMAREVFIGNSPTIRPHLGSYLAMKVQTIISPASNFIARLQGKNEGSTNKNTIEGRYAALQNVPFSQISKGVVAREKDGVAEVRYELNNINWIEYSYTTRDGKKIIIKVPEGQKPPPAGAL